MSLENMALIMLVRAHLQDDKRLAALPVDVTSSDGYIQLVGWVDTEEQRQLAILLARGIVGVRNVEDHISVRARVTLQAA